MNILFINPLDTSISFFIIQEGGINTFTLEGKDDFSTFPEALVDIVDQYNIAEIWCVLGPGPFTRMRIITLAVNTLYIARGIQLKGCHFFDIIDSGTPLIRANDREYIICLKNETPSLISKENIPEGIYSGYGNENDFTNGRDFIKYKENIPSIHRIFEKIPYSEGLSPLYYKDPHITWSKKNTSHS